MGAQMLALGLAADTIKGRCRVVSRYSRTSTVAVTRIGGIAGAQRDAAELTYAH